MNGDLALLEAFEAAFTAQFGRGNGPAELNFGLGLPDLLLYPARGILAGLPLRLGLQTCGQVASGAHTGETSPQLAADLGADFVIVGHSERRADQGEDSALIRTKAEAAQAAGLLPIICVGETLAEREAGQAEEVTLGQVRESCPAQGAYLIAYEPVWAIGTGKVASAGDAQAMHAAIRAILPDPTTAILYGGSMKASNAGELLAQPDINGGLIGGASLKPEDLLAIYDAAP